MSDERASLVEARYLVQFYPFNQAWLVSDGPLESNSHTLASFDNEDDATRFRDAYVAWENNQTPPRPSDFGGERSYGSYCRVPLCGNHVNRDNIKCPEHGGAATG